MIKRCKKCEQTKDISEFYKHIKMTDGYLSFCKTCVKARMKAYSKTERCKENGRLWRKTDKGKASIQREGKRHSQKYPTRRKARHKISNAIRDKRLFRKPCEVCSSTFNVEGHHPDYKEPLKVVWLCSKHHKELHKQLEVTA